MASNLYGRGRSNVQTEDDSWKAVAYLNVSGVSPDGKPIQLGKTGVTLMANRRNDSAFIDAVSKMDEAQKAKFLGSLKIEYRLAEDPKAAAVTFAIAQ